MVDTTNKIIERETIQNPEFNVGRMSSAKLNSIASLDTFLNAITIKV